MSISASLKISAASWQSSCEWALSELPLWVGQSINLKSCDLAQISIDFGDEYLLRPVVQRVYKRLGTFARAHTLPSISQGLESNGLLWSKQLVFWCLNRGLGRFLFYFWRRIILKSFSYLCFSLIVVCLYWSLTSGAGSLKLASWPTSKL